jgi:hypothetical protein
LLLKARAREEKRSKEKRMEEEKIQGEKWGNREGRRRR